VHLSSLQDDFYIFDQERGHLIGRRTRRIIKLGDKVAVQVFKVDSFKKQVDFQLVPGEAAVSPRPQAAARPQPAPRSQIPSRPPSSAPLPSSTRPPVPVARRQPFPVANDSRRRPGESAARRHPGGNFKPNRRRR
jgi:ribonuclease R